MKRLLKRHENRKNAMDHTTANNIMASQPDDHDLLRSAAERAYGLLWMYLGTD